MQGIIEHHNFDFPITHWYCISIYGDEGKLLTPEAITVLNGLGMVDSISLDFWDIVRDHTNNFPESILFNKEHAKEIVTFIDVIQKDPIDSTLVVHCHAGISRSGAIGVFACDYCKTDYNQLMKDNPYIWPNNHILRLLREEANITPTFDFKSCIPILER